MKSKPDSYDSHQCPHCGAITQSKALWSVANVIPAALLAICVIIDMVLTEPLTTEPGSSQLRFKRRCLDCGGIFREKARLGKDPLCGNCDYNLTGNVTGVCSECGWRITRRMKRRIAIANRRAARVSD